ncbi:Surface antigen [Limimonas halophila]|uniref:Surface antigen n=1 Tax=Limimonas halophila TaxID=1082479 RepID=A0A1G7L1R0_9PROT|nr:RT0821/Lpp0805 family surface protein [Limimonas halophila]SDF43405.1 Surface antigen [Limimonas halophila]
MNKQIRTAAVCVLLGSVSLTALAGCESIEQETGVKKETQMGAGAGAAAGGLLAILANANPGWVAASTILGGVAGGVLSEYLSEEDAKKHAANQFQSLQNLEEGETNTWTNDETGNSGKTTVTKVFTMADGTECKNFVEEIDTGERTFKETGTACKKPGGQWKVRTG